MVLFSDEPFVFVSFVLFCLFCCFTSQVNSYGHCGTVSSPNHTFLNMHKQKNYLLKLVAFY